METAFTNVSIQLSFNEGLTILGLSLAAGLFLRYLYYRFSLSFSSKLSFGNTLLIVTISVASLIAVVKTSLALSLGLVGALSVIRFRTAVKEPYNLSFILFSICIGISIGATQYLFALMIACVGSVAIFLAYRSAKQNSKSISSMNFDDIDTLCLTLPSNASIQNLYSLLSGTTRHYSIISFDQQDNEDMTIVINIKLVTNSSMNNLRESIFKQFPGSKFSFYNSPST